MNGEAKIGRNLLLGLVAFGIALFISFHYYRNIKASLSNLSNFQGNFFPYRCACANRQRNQVYPVSSKVLGKIPRAYVKSLDFASY